MPTEILKGWPEVNWTIVLIAFCGIVFIASALILVVCLAIGLVRLVAAWRREPAHAYPGPEPVEKWLPEVFGSMQLDEDREVWADRNAGRFDSALGSPVNSYALSGAAGLPTPVGWRERTAAELAPDTLAIAHEDWIPGPYGLIPPEPEAIERAWPAEPEPAPEPEPEAPAVESRAEWLRRLQRDAAPGWTFAGGMAA
jgi:hypothetical protein